MIDKPDPKDAGRKDDPSAKRPHATLDLKATEVRPPSQAATAGTGSASTATAASSSTSPQGTSSASSSPPGSATGAASSAPAGPAGSKLGASGPADTTGKSSASSPTPPKTAASKPDGSSARPAPSRGGGFFSHLFAGLVGGGLVYAGSTFLPAPPNSTTAELASRVAALEATPKPNVDAASIDAKMSDAESRLAKLEELQNTVATLSEAQGALQTETKALAEAQQQGGGGNVSAERLSKLEEQLAMIASSSQSSEGRIPQLAAITGKISDLETSLAGQIASLRKSLPADVDQRLAASAEAAEAAKAATSRIDRDVTQLRNDQARSAQQAEAQKASVDRLAAAVEAAKEEAARLSSVVGELRSSVETQLKSVTRPADVSAAIGPVNSKIAELEQSVQTVVKSEQSRKQDAERIVLSLELSNLKRALDRGLGQGYAPELEEVRKASAGQLDLAALDRFKDTGVASLAQLKAEFRPVMNAVLDADLEPSDGSVIDRLLAGAKSVVRVRKINHEAGDTSSEAIVARIEAALNDGRLGDVITEAKALPQRAQAPIEDWLAKVSARHSVDQAIATLDGRLKASLSGAPDVPPPPAATPPAPAKN